MWITCILASQRIPSNFYLTCGLWCTDPQASHQITYSRSVMRATYLAQTQEVHFLAYTLKSFGLFSISISMYYSQGIRQEKGRIFSVTGTGPHSAM